ncbi:hypothetical protein AYO44_04050 [Planctomycetaceae bacterium SCGC AG-212-F19]|nr:hypothetical protein AYO44_04050 [Planctomycetaceae bacterium SCGC AG-212-F19]
MANDILPIFPRDDDDDTFEVIDPAEIDFVMNGLAQLIRKVQSPTIKELLETARLDMASLSDDDLLAADGADDTDEPRQAA